MALHLTRFCKAHHGGRIGHDRAQHRLSRPTGSTASWTDPKRHLWLIGLVVPSLFFIGYAGWLATGAQQWSGLWFWIGPVIVLVVVPAIDLLVGLDRSNPPDDVIEALENDRYYRWITYLFLPIQYVAFPAAMYLVVEGDPFFGGGELATWEKVGLAISIGVIGGIGINTAHELGHKKESHERWLSKIALAQVFYGHFYIEHNRGHHVRVATPEDPASARMGETFYQFWPRTVVGSVTSAWRVEKKRYARKKKHPFRLGNDVLNAWLMSVVLWGGLVAWLGIGVLPYLVLQAVIGFSLLEIVNFMEHYGMLRQKVGVGERAALRAGRPPALLELQQHRDQRAALPPAAAQRPPRQPDPALPGAARLRGVAGAADRVRRDDRARARPADLPPGDGPAGAQRTTGRPDAGEPVAAQAGQAPGGVPASGSSTPPARAEDAISAAAVEQVEVLAARCPGCGYTYSVEAGDEHEGFAAGTAWADVPDSWCCPDCGVREKVDFVPVDRESVAVRPCLDERHVA